MRPSPLRPTRIRNIYPLRLARLALHLIQGVATAGFVFPWVSKSRERALIRNWSEKLLRILKVELKISGLAPNPETAWNSGQPAMVIANHVSWLDIFAIQAVCPSRFVSKSEVRSWPIIGWLCEKAGTLFIARGTRADVKRINGKLSALLVSGEIVALFPEGMTTEGGRVAPFHASLLQAAHVSRARLWPVAIRYLRPDGSPNMEAAYAGDVGFGDSLRAIARQPRIIAELTFAETIAPGGATRGVLARSARERIIAALGPAADGNRLEKPGDPRAGSPTMRRPTDSRYRAQADSAPCANPAPTSDQKRVS